MEKLTALQNALNNGKEWYYIHANNGSMCYLTNEEYINNMKNSYANYVNECYNDDDICSFDEWCNSDDHIKHIESEICTLENL